MTDGPLIVGIGGSADADSSTTRLLRECLRLTEALGARTTMLDGVQLAELPIFTPTRSGTVSPGVPAAGSLVEAVRHADALVVATPGYHGGMSGLVKNALDHLEPLREDVRPYLDGRAVGVIVTAAGWQACGSTLVSVRSAIHALRGWPTPFGVTVNTVEQQLDDEKVRGALRVLAGQLVEFTSWQAAARAPIGR